MTGRIFAILALSAGAMAAVACVDVPDNMRAEFSGPGPGDRTNYKPGNHGTAPANWTHFKVSGGYDAGAPDAAPAVAPPLPADLDAGMPMSMPVDGGNNT